MIPVLGVPILARPELLVEMLASIDVEIGQIVIVDNGDHDPDQFPWPGAHQRIVRPGHNLGVAASWNLVMRTTPLAPWWAMANFDLRFAPGDLDRLDQHMTANLGPEGMVALLGTFAAFGVDRSAIDRAGMFDENFHPAYFEDNDFDYRCRLAGVPMAGLPAGLSHRISSTIDSDPQYTRENQRTFPLNAAYYERKWGGSPRNEVFTTPFNEGGDLRSWRLDVNRLAAQSWKKE